jgi:hypothetical protein
MSMNRFTGCHVFSHLSCSRLLCTASEIIYESVLLWKCLGCHCVVCSYRVSFNQYIISGRKNEAGNGAQDDKCPSFK